MSLRGTKQSNNQEIASRLAMTCYTVCLRESRSECINHVIIKQVSDTCMFNDA